ncbi:MAG: hypothetical protein PHD76_05710 [Methylacidiphilales bacterium]|nr:hypothetical protein [Candidatus Methylacidiphilales bacterium]
MKNEQDNVTLEAGATAARREIPCFLCNDLVEIRMDKRAKPYFICDACGVQTFVRRKSGISKLEILIKDIQSDISSALKVSALTIQLLELKKRLQEVENSRGILGLFTENKALDEAKELIQREIQGLDNQIDQLNQKPDIITKSATKTARKP